MTVDFDQVLPLENHTELYRNELKYKYSVNLSLEGGNLVSTFFLASSRITCLELKK